MLGNHVAVQQEVRAVKTSTWPLKQSSSFPMHLPLSHSAGDAASEGCTSDSPPLTGPPGNVNSYFLFGHGS